MNTHTIADPFVNKTAKGKPCLVVEPGKLDALADQAMHILTDEGIDIFQRGGKLVRPVVQEGVDCQGNPVHFPVLQEVSFAFMRKMLSRHIEWSKPDLRTRKKGSPQKGFLRIEAPKEIAETIMSNAGFWTFRTVAGIISTPTLRFDGSILSEPGYDPRTHLYLQTDVALPPIPASPTRADAERALELLEDLLTEFPFVNEASKSVELSAMLSTVARNMFDVCPAHGSRAPAAGSGKSYLSDVVSAIVYGEKCPVISVSEKPDETEKRVVGAALSGQLIVNFDNVNGTLGGDTLCQLTERPILSLRPLGRSEHVRVENRSIVFFNGNNCRVHGDMSRRVLLADLDAREERPAERKFKGDPVAKIKKNRGTYIAACMTVLRAFIMAGKPDQKITPMNSYEQWSGTVRSALVWLNRADPCLTVQKVRDEDPELQRLSAFIAAARFHIEDKDNAMAASDLVKKSQQMAPSGAVSLHGQREVEPVHPDLYDFMLSFLGHGGKPDARRLGIWLSQNTHRIISAEDDSGNPTIRLRIAKLRDKTRNVDKWFIENVTVTPITDQFDRDSGSYGTVFHSTCGKLRCANF